MSALQSFFSACAHVVVATIVGLGTLFGSVFSLHSAVVLRSTPGEQQTAQQNATSTNSFPVAGAATNTSATSTPTKKVPPAQTSAAVAVTTPTTPPPAIVQTKTGDEVNAGTRNALVNIICTTKGQGYFHPISGSGVIIDSAGVILTNAHVAQYFLLQDYPTPNYVDCIVRVGSPAMAKYHATILYLPPAWVDKNASQIAAQEATGTGENDYAFLLITSSIDGSPLPALFPAVAMTTDPPMRGDPILLASYPAGFLDGVTIQTSLYIASTFTAIEDIFTFNDQGYVDLASLGGTVVSQAGSSGGAVARRQDGALLGIIATATQGTTTDSRDLRAITLGHVDRSLHAQGQGGIAALLSGNLEKEAAFFSATIAPVEKKALIDAL